MRRASDLKSWVIKWIKLKDPSPRVLYRLLGLVLVAFVAAFVIGRHTIDPSLPDTVEAWSPFHS